MNRGAATAFLLALLASPGGADEAYNAGKAVFERKWDQGAEGLGPLFNAKSCNGCHKDGGPSRVFKVGDHWTARGAVIRIGAKDGTPDTWYGKQLQDIAAEGVTPEAVIAFDFSGMPSAQIELLGPATYIGSPIEIRLAPSLLGRRLLEEVNPESILALEDPTDADGDGISGRARKLFGGAIGRFGHKADTPTVERQSVEAAAIDMGLSSPDLDKPLGDCMPSQFDCIAQATAKEPELDAESLELLTAFVRSLEAPKPAADEAAEKLFAETGCAACHVPSMPDGNGNPLPVFTDLLLHDMGEALSGAHGGGGFSPSEWRTAPLIDLAPLDGLRRYLHDGRAKTIAEAIELHGGEGEKSAAQFSALDQSAKKQLLDYLARL